MKRSRSIKKLVLVSALGYAATLPQTAGAVVDLTNLLSTLDATADGQWARVNLNNFSDAWPDLADRPLNDTSRASPSAIISAWSSFAWDSKRGQLILFGGGHANYAGNDVYLWNGTTQLWGRGSLPSNVTPMPTSVGNLYNAVDGVFNAPASIHTYDNTGYLAVADRYIALGGAAYDSGGPWLKDDNGTLRLTGPYLWDPSKADPNKVGGTTGSGVDPAVLGGQMWQNRDNRSLFVVNTFLGALPISYPDGTTAFAQEGGKDVVYFTGTAASEQYLLKYTINDVNDPALDTVSLVGAANGPLRPYGSAGYDSASGIYVAMSNSASTPFIAWDTDNPHGLSNVGDDISFVVSGAAAFDAAIIAGIDWDPTREQFLVWNGVGDVWSLKAPSSGNIADEWTLELVTDGDLLAAADHPDGLDLLDHGAHRGVRGKWKYIPNLDAFMALEGNSAGEIWLYRPEGWVTPVPEPTTLGMLAGGLGLLGWRLRGGRRAG